MKKSVSSQESHRLALVFTTLLANQLHQHHKLTNCHKTFDFRAVIFPWAIHYVSCAVVGERSDLSYKNRVDVSEFGVKESKPVDAIVCITNTSADFIRRLKSDFKFRYNFQSLLRHDNNSGVRIFEASTQMARHPDYRGSSQTKFVQVLRKLFLRYLRYLFAFKGTGVCFSRLYVPKKLVLALWLIQGWRPIDMKSSPAGSGGLDIGARKSLIESLLSLKLGSVSSEVISQRLYRLTLFTLPKSLIEDFESIIRWAEYEYDRLGKPKYVITANAHYYDDAYNIFAALVRSKGGRHVVLQHGFPWWWIPNSPAPTLEQLAADKLCIWGKDQCQVGSGFDGWVLFNIPCLRLKPAIKKIAKKFNICSVRKKILIVGNEASVYKTPTGLELDTDYYDLYIEFIAKIAEIAEYSGHECKLRQKNSENCWQTERILKDKQKGIIFSNSNTCSLEKDLALSDLIIVPYWGFSFFHAIASGKPTVLIFDYRYLNQPRESMDTTGLGELKKIGLAYDSFESFEASFENIINSPDQYWNVESQKIIATFVDKYIDPPMSYWDASKKLNAAVLRS